MKHILEAIQRGAFTKTLAINVPELLESQFSVNCYGSSFEGNCRTHTLIHVEGLTLAFTKRAFVKYQPSMPSASKFDFNYYVEEFNSWQVEKIQCTNSLNLSNPSIKEAISYLMKSGLLEYNLKDDDSLVLQIRQYHAEKNGISHSGLDADALNNKLIENIIKSPLFREMDSFFS